MEKERRILAKHLQQLSFPIFRETFKDKRTKKEKDHKKRNADGFRGNLDIRVVRKDRNLVDLDNINADK